MLEQTRALESLPQELSAREYQQESLINESYFRFISTLPEENGIKDAVIDFIDNFENVEENGVFLLPSQRLNYVVSEAILRTILSVSPDFVDMSTRSSMMPAAVFIREQDDVSEENKRWFTELVDHLNADPAKYFVVSRVIETKFRASDV